MPRENLGEITFKLPNQTPIPTGEESLCKVVELVQSSLRAEFPKMGKLMWEDTQGNAVPLLDRLVTSVDRIQSRNGKDLAKKERAENPTSDSILFRLMRAAGLAAPRLWQGMYRTSRGENSYYKRDDLCPTLYLHKDYLAELYKRVRTTNDFASQIVSASTLGIKLIGINMELIPKPVEIPADLKPKVQEKMKTDTGKHLFEPLAKETKDDLEVDQVSLEVTAAVIKALIDCDRPDYQPRFIALGGKVVLVLPHQSLQTYEFPIGLTSDHDITNYLTGRVLTRFFRGFGSVYGIKPTEVLLPAGYQESVKRGRVLNQLLGLWENSSAAKSFGAYFHSKYPEMILRSKKREFKAGGDYSY